MKNPLVRTLIQYGDDNLILAQRLCEWSGHAPTIEVDLSLSNLALDLVGQATLLLDYAGELEDAQRNANQLAFHRDCEQFSNCLLVEQPNGDFAQTIARQFLYTTYALALFRSLESSRDERIAAIAAKATKELAYHVDFSADWVIRLGDGTEESHQRLVDGFDWHWRFLDDLFTMTDDERALAGQGFIVDRAAIRGQFEERVNQTLAVATLPPKPDVWQVTGGRIGKHTEHLGPLLAEMQVLPRSHPEAIW